MPCKDICRVHFQFYFVRLSGGLSSANQIAPRDLAQSFKSIGETYLKMNDSAKAKPAYLQASEILQNLINQNALGETDRKMFDEDADRSAKIVKSGISSGAKKPFA